MNLLQLVFTPTKRRRLNELVALCLFVSAALLFLSIVSYHPADPSLNTSAPGVAIHPVHNWIGMVGALVADLLLQFAGAPILVLPVMLAMLGVRWWKSQPVIAPMMKVVGGVALMVFTPAMLAILPWRILWRGAVPIEGLIGRIVGDFLLHYFNITGAYILSFAAISIALYMCTAFSLGNLHLWMQTRFTWVYALRDRYQDWVAARNRAKAAKQAEKLAKKLEKEKEAQREVKPVITTQLLPAKRDIVLSGPARPVTGVIMKSAPVEEVDESKLTGIDRALGLSKSAASSTNTGAFNVPLADYSLPSITEAIPPKLL